MPILASFINASNIHVYLKGDSMSTRKQRAAERHVYRTAARVWLDISEIVAQDLPVACSFIGAYCYVMDVPVTVYNISKLHFVGSYRTAKRYCDLMVEAGALEYMPCGSVRCTEAGNHTSDWYFRALFELSSQVPEMLRQTEETKL